MQDMFGGPLLAISYGLMIAHLAETKWLHKLVTDHLIRWKNVL